MITEPTDRERTLELLLAQAERDHYEDMQHITRLNAEVVRLQKMLDINDPTLEKVTIHRRDYKQLKDTEALAVEFASTILQVDGT